MRMRNWVFADTYQDESSRTFQRVFEGRMTPLRWSIIINAVKKHNESGHAPFGRSARGYAYGCGHDWDCCGCMFYAHMKFDILAPNKVRLTVSKSYNY